MSAVDELRARVPFFGVPRRELNVAQRRERAAAVNRLSPADRELYSREVGRLHRLAGHNGGTRRTDSRFLDPDAERLAISELRAHGLDVDAKGEPLSGEPLRRRAKSWLVAKSEALAETATPTSIDVQIAYHEAEMNRWRETARLDRARARQHDELATEHETALVKLMRETGRS